MALAFSSGGIGAAFHSRNYKIYWWGTLPHSLGAWVYRLAIAWLTWELTRSPLWLGLIAFAHMLPVLTLCPLAGATADRYGHRVQLMLAISLTAAEVLVLAILTAGGLVTIEILLVLAFINGTGRTFAMPSRQAFVVQLVEPRHMSAAIGVGSATHHGANFVGPALAGLLIAQYGVAAAFLYLVASAVLAVGAIAGIRIQSQAFVGTASGLIGDIVEGVRYAVRHEGIRVVILIEGVLALFIQPYMEMLAAVADRVLGMGAGGLSLLASASGLGAMSGGLWIAWRGRTEGLTRILLAGVAAALVALLVFALSRTLWLSLPALYVTGFSLIAASACASSLIQVSVAPALRARVMALDSMMNSGGPALGAVVVGWAGAELGIQVPLAAAAAVGAVGWLLLAPRVTRQRRLLEAGGLARRAPQAAQ